MAPVVPGEPVVPLALPEPLMRLEPAEPFMPDVLPLAAPSFIEDVEGWLVVPDVLEDMPEDMPEAWSLDVFLAFLVFFLCIARSDDGIAMLSPFVPLTGRLPAPGDGALVEEPVDIAASLLAVCAMAVDAKASRPAKRVVRLNVFMVFLR